MKVGLIYQRSERQGITMQRLVLCHAGFRKDSPMPSRKSESCAHRKRLGQNVASLRARQRLTQEKLVEKIGVSPRYVQSVEAGEYFPSLPTLVHLSVVLRCDWNELFAGCESV